MTDTVSRKALIDRDRTVKWIREVSSFGERVKTKLIKKLTDGTFDVIPSTESEGEADTPDLKWWNEHAKTLTEIGASYKADADRMRTELAEADAWCEYWRRGALRQHPTQDAYDAACRAMEKHRAEAERLRAYMRLIKADEMMTKLKRTNVTRLVDEALESSTSSKAPKARTIDEWHEDLGNVLWWIFPIVEPPYVGSPLACDWPGCHTHWTDIPIPESKAKELDWDDREPIAEGDYRYYTTRREYPLPSEFNDHGNDYDPLGG